MNTLNKFTGLFCCLALVLLAASPLSIQAANKKSLTITKNGQNQFVVSELPYAAGALAPAISGNTINYHYGKHLQAYVNNLNKLIAGTALENADLETILKQSDGAVFNNAAQAWNHVFYFNTFSPDAKQMPSGKLLAAIEKQWGSFDNFKKEFETAGNAVFGSGWVWLASDKAGKLMIMQESNAGNPVSKGLTPLLGIDVWEHSYYLDYQNRRADHLHQLWTIIDWEQIEPRY